MAQSHPAILFDPSLGEIPAMAQQGDAPDTGKADAGDSGMQSWRDWRVNENSQCEES